MSVTCCKIMHFLHLLMSLWHNPEPSQNFYGGGVGITICDSVKGNIATGLCLLLFTTHGGNLWAAEQLLLCLNYFGIKTCK